jgi:hypothetical protein
MTLGERLRKKLEAYQERRERAAARRERRRAEKKRHNLLRAGALRACLAHRRRYGFPKPGCKCKNCYRDEYTRRIGSRWTATTDEAIQMWDGGVG